ncbi:MAG: VOC family protein [Phycisphaerales bacterium]|nr:VOC family protein [Phycisphaerales bacterium]
MLNEIENMIEGFEQGKMTRRQLVVRVGALMAAVAGMERIASASGRKPVASTFDAVALNHIALDVTDVRRARDFYQKHLGLTVRRDGGDESCFMNCGEHFLALFRNKTPGMNHYCYTIKNYDPGRAVDKLKAVGLKPRRTSDRVYFDDPDGITVQVSAPNK